jgi:hypothetical protein
MRQSLFIAIVMVLVTACGGDYTVTPDFVSNRNQCLPDYLTLGAPVLLDPEAVILEPASSSNPTYGQRLVVEKNEWYYSIQLRLNTPNFEPEIEAELYQNGTSPVASYSSLQTSMPDDTIGGFMVNAVIDTAMIDKTETWMDLVFSEPQQLSTDQVYWALITPKSSDIAWTTVQGNGFAKFNDDWEISANRSATLRAVPCEDR